MKSYSLKSPLTVKISEICFRLIRMGREARGPSVWVRKEMKTGQEAMLLKLAGGVFLMLCFSHLCVCTTNIPPRKFRSKYNKYHSAFVCFKLECSVEGFPASAQSTYIMQRRYFFSLFILRVNLWLHWPHAPPTALSTMALVL